MLTPVFVTLAALGAAVTVEVSPAAPCGLAASLAPALVAAGLEVQPRATFKVDARGDAQRIVIRLTDGAQRLRGMREFAPSGDDCSVFAKTVALLVKWWLSPQLKLAEPAPKPAPPRARPHAERREPTAAPAVPAEAPTRAALTEVLVPPSAPEPEPTVSSPPSVVATAEPRAEGRRITGAVAAIGSLAFAPADQSVGAATLTGELGLFEPIALTIEGGAQTNRTARAAGGSVSVGMQWVGLGARVLINATDVSQFSLGAGLHLAVLEAQSSGYLVNRSATLLTGGAQLSAEWRQALLGGAFIVARLEGQLRIRAETFSVDGVGEVARLPMWGFLAGVGVGWTFR